MSLNREQGIELRMVIEERRAALLAELREDAARVRRDQHGELTGPAPDAGDESVADLIADLDHAELDRDLNELREIEAARQRLEEGSYGVCVNCGVEIDYRRLRASPAAIRCIDCQRQYEKTHKGGVGPTL
jgi:RNA polymerase-binding protein DksA